MTVVINGTSGITDVNGTAAAPAITGTDTDTGVFFGTNTVSLSTGGTERLQIDSSGNAGLGVTPSAWTSPTMQFGSDTSFGPYGYLRNGYYDGSNFKYISSTAASRYAQSGGQHLWYNAASGTAGNAITFTQAMTLDASGNLFLGTTGITGGLSGQVFNLFGSGTVRSIVQTTGQFSVYNLGSGGTSVSPATAGFLLTDSSANTLNLYASTNTPLLFGTNNTERARIDSSGNLLIGTTNTASNSGNGCKISNTGFLGVVGTAGDTYNFYNSTAGAYRFYVTSAGVINATSTTITAISDQRLKENIQDIDVGLDAVMALKPRKFDWKQGKGKDKKGDRGWIAQEFEQVFPDMITTWKDEPPEGEEPYKAVNADLIPVLVKAIQEQQAIITQLQADVAALKAKA